VTIKGILGAAAALTAGSALLRNLTDGVPVDELRARLGRMTMEQMSRRVPRGVRQPPQMAVTLDDKKAEPRDIAVHPFPNLIYVVTPDTMEENRLRVYVRPEAAMEYIKDVQARYKKPDEPTRTKVLRSSSDLSSTSQALTQGYYGAVGGYITLHEHGDYAGAAWTFWADWGTIRDFRRVFCFLWWCQNINDRASSADVNVDYIDPAIPQMAYAILFENINLGGAQLWLWSGSAPGGPGLYPNLGIYGWNDVASSLRYF
jgi:hypothetical protein